MEQLGIDGKLLLAQLINFALFFYIFHRFMAKPFKKFILGEKAKDVEKERLLGELKSGEEKLALQKSDAESKLKEERAKIVAAAKLEAEEVKKQIVEDARVEAEAIRDSAKGVLEAERTALYRELKDKIVELSFSIVDATLKKSLTEQCKKQVTRDILKNLKERDIAHEN